MEHVEVGPFSPAEIEKVYSDLMSSGFYSETYNSEDWNPEPYSLMANILADVFSLGKASLITAIFSKPADSKEVLDLGCGVGFLVKSLRKMRVAANGIEFSPKIFERIDPATQKHVQLLNPDFFLNSFDLSKFNVVTALEVFEHLPISLIKRYLMKFHQNFDGRLFLTIPSSGVDPWSGRVIFTESSATRLADMDAHRVFSHLAMLNGKPGGGHITLASYRWWTDFFFANGFIRDLTLEKKLKSYEAIFSAYRWCPYILKKASVGSIHLGRGWHSTNGGTKGVWSTNYSEVLFSVRDTHLTIKIEFHWPDPNRNLEHFFHLSVFEIAEDISYSGVLSTKIVSQIIEYNRPQGSEACFIKVPISLPTINSRDSSSGRYGKIVIAGPVSHQLDNSAISSPVGINVIGIQIESGSQTFTVDLETNG